MASTLQAYAKKRKKEETTVITARLPHSKYNAFKNYCDDLGLSINEAINLLINAELKEASKENKNINKNVIQEVNTEVNDDVNQVTIDDVINDESAVTIESEEINNTTMNTKVNTNKSAGRFKYEPYMNNHKQVPCPICEKFYGTSNFVKHTKNQHKITPEKLLTSEIYQEKIKAMLEGKGV